MIKSKLALALGLAVISLSTFAAKNPSNPPAGSEPKHGESYICTAFFISADGYIGTAGHCAGVNMQGILVNGKTVVEQPVHIVAVDHVNDTMLLKMDNVSNEPYYSLNTNPQFAGESIGYIGYPDPDQYGWFKHTAIGTYNGKVAQGVYEANLWSAPGTSGSCVYDSNDVCQGILTEGMYIMNIFVYTGIRPISTLITMAKAAGVQASYVASTGLPLNKTLNTNLYNTTSNKVLLITGQIK